MIFFNFNLIL